MQNAHMPSHEEVEYLLQARRDVVLNADYATDASLPKARKFEAAIKRLILLLPRRGQGGGQGGESVEFDTATLQKMSEEVQRWIANHQSARCGGTHLLGFDNYRS